MNTKMGMEISFNGANQLRIDNSARTTFQECPRKFFWSTVANKIPATGSSALRFGSVIHAGMEEYYKQMQSAQAKNQTKDFTFDFVAVATAMKNEWDELTKKQMFYVDYRNLENAITSVVEYIKTHPTEITYNEILEVEKGFNIPVGHMFNRSGSKVDIFFTGKMDGLAVAHGGLWIIEHKSTSEGITQIKKKLNRSHQMIGYFAALHLMKNEYTESPVGVMVNVLRTFSKRNAKGEYGMLSQESSTFPQIYTISDVHNWIESFNYTAQQIINCYAADTWPMQFNACYNWGECVYTALCTQNKNCLAMMDDGYSLSGYVDNNWDPMK